MELNFDRLYQAIPQDPRAPFIFSSNLSISDIINALLVYIFPVVGLLLLIFIVIGGFLFLTSGGDPKKIQSAKAVLTTSFLLFIIVFSAFWITQIVGMILGIPDLYIVGSRY